MDFDLQTFYEQLGASAELVFCTRMLDNDTLYQHFYTPNALFDVIIGVNSHKVISITIIDKSHKGE